METENKVYCYDNTGKNKCSCTKKTCLLVIIEIFLAAFTTSLGILIGALASTAIMEAMAALIVFIVLAALLLIVSIILYFCQKKKSKKKECH